MFAEKQHALDFPIIRATATIPSLILGLTFFCTPAFAQDETSDLDEDSDLNRLEEVIVTATRREQTVFEVPLAITALTGEELEMNLQDDLADYFRTVPGVTMTQQSSGLNTISIRGISGGGGQRAKAPVSFYIDDMPVVSDPVATPDIKTFDVERVEVLRGPQGTLFGESSLGGVVRVISRQPNLQEFEGKVRASYLTFDPGEGGYTFDGAINTPIVEDTFAIRASFSHRDEGGWIDNIAPGGTDNQNDLDYSNFRITPYWQVNDKLSISATAYVVRSEYGSRQFGDENYQQEIFVDETRDDDIDQYNITVKYDFDSVLFTSSTNWFARDTFRNFDLTSIFGFLPPLLELEGAVPPGWTYDQYWQTLEINDDSFSQEFRLLSNTGGAWRWTAGLYYYDTDNFVGVDFLSNPPIDFTVLNLDRTETYDQTAAYGEIEWDFAENWTAVAGIRYTEENRNIHYIQQDDWTIGFRFLPTTGVFDVDIDYDVWTPKFALQWQPSENSQIYASATKGFRGPGGNTDYNDDGVRLNIYGPEYVWTYELGTKLLLADGKASLEGAVFFTDWEDRQEVVNPEAPFNEQYVDNIGTVEIKGVELVASYVMTDYLSIGGQVTYIDSEITESARTEWIGLPLTGQPEWRGSLFADIIFPITDGLDFRAHVDGIYQDDVIWNLSDPVPSSQYSLWNITAGVAANRWSADLFVRNAGNEFVAFGTGMNVYIGEPRVYGVSATYAF